MIERLITYGGHRAGNLCVENTALCESICSNGCNGVGITVVYYRRRNGHRSPYIMYTCHLYRSFSHIVVGNHKVKFSGLETCCCRDIKDIVSVGIPVGCSLVIGFRICRYVDSTARSILVKDLSAESRNTGCKDGHPVQVGTAVEGSTIDRCYSCAKRRLIQVRTTFESRIANGCNAIGNHDFPQTCAIIEGITANTCYALRYGDRCHS